MVSDRNAMARVASRSRKRSYCGGQKWQYSPQSTRCYGNGKTIGKTRHTRNTGMLVRPRMGYSRRKGKGDKPRWNPWEPTRPLKKNADLRINYRIYHLSKGRIRG